MGIMRFITVNSCCGFDLRTGGIILGFIDLFVRSTTIMFGFPFLQSVVAGIISVLFLFGDISWIYGIQQKKTRFMLPNVCITLLFLCVLIFYVVTLTIIAPTHTSDDNFSSLWIVIALITLFYWYIAAVKFSLFRAMNEENNRPQMQCKFSNI